jgi:hypothetical protein
MTNAALLGSFGDVSGGPLVFRNKIINGGFNIWQRGTSQTSAGYGSDDRWYNDNTGSTKTTSRQPFTLGQTDVPNNPTYYSRTVVSSVAGAGNYVAKYQRLESVSSLSGQTATFSFWAKADASKNIAIEFIQNFGSGGSPSAQVTSIGVTTIALTTVWQRFFVTASIPSITGKTLGTNNDDFLQAIFWFDAGSTFNSRTNSLGQQSGTFDIANAQLEAGNVPTPFEQRHVGTELALCQRYYEKSYNIDVAPNTNTLVGSWYLIGSSDNAGNCGITLAFKITKRATPVFTAYLDAGGDGWGYNRSATGGTIATASLNVGRLGASGGLVYGAVGASNVTASMNGHWTVSAEL